MLLLTEKQQANFWRHVDKSGGTDACWPWMGLRTRLMQYGCFSINKRIRMAHRVAYRIQFGYFPIHLKICHRCDNPPCCNPSHHFVGTQAENVADMDAKGRRRPPTPENSGFRRHPELAMRGEKNGFAKLTAENALSIRREFSTGTIYKRELAAKYGVSPFAIHCIIIRKTWRHLPDEFDGPIIGKGTQNKPQITRWQLDKLPPEQKKNYTRRA